jgi:hypothetical protein
VTPTARPPTGAPPHPEAARRPRRCSSRPAPFGEVTPLNGVQSFVATQVKSGGHVVALDFGNGLNDPVIGIVPVEPVWA